MAVWSSLQVWRDQGEGLRVSAKFEAGYDCEGTHGPDANDIDDIKVSKDRQQGVEEEGR